ncbi:hypothetical protein G5714_018525 [Onychostoma macrolepis]|uniref:Uncharacterized protein n=1 Tax=Onychostoma macrolepis TaxID=369639 RepID=A0A7J6BZ90_9TELE|nr:hypothetical protein G5714_018525 [Onychostoma macrolepis]
MDQDVFRNSEGKQLRFRDLNLCENTKNAFEWLGIDAEVTFNRGNIKRHFLSLEMRSRRGSWSSQGKH